MRQPQVSVWVGQLTPLVNAALGRELHLFARRPADLERLLAEAPELRLRSVDGTERPLRRSKDDKKAAPGPQRQKEGAPQKEPARHAERRVVCLGRTAPGSVHDKQLG